MRIKDPITAFGLTVAIVVFQMLGEPNNKLKEAQAQPVRPYAVFVNGHGNCCTWEMNDLIKRLNNLGLGRADMRFVPYSTFEDNDFSGPTDNDSRFLKEGTKFINEELDSARPLILIGHSFGADSILKLLPRINRRIQFVGVIDPVASGGFRTRRVVPSKVDYFVNRWQEVEPWPTNFWEDGRMSSRALHNFQDNQNNAANSQGKGITTKCKWFETCDRKAVRTSHQGLAKDGKVQKILGDRIEEALANFSPPTPTGWVKIQNRNWNRCLNLQSATKNGVGVDSWECVSHKDQEWKITNIGSGYVRIQNRNWNRCLNLQSATKNGVGVNSWECVSHPDQEWKISPL